MTTPNIVLRVELENGTGIFVAGLVPNKIQRKMPGPYSDNIPIDFYPNYIFGFHNMDDLIYYFFDEMDSFINTIKAQNHDIDDVGIAEYEYKAILKGGSQCAFLPTKKISWIPISQFYLK